MRVWFEGEAIDRLYPGDRFLRIIREPYYILWEHEETHGSLMIPVNFVTDLASVPRPLWSIVPPWDNYIRDAAVAHDRAYESNEISRELADDLLYYGMIARGASRAHASLVWSAVRMFGAPSYRTGKQRQRERIAKLIALEHSGQKTKEHISGTE